MEIWCPCLFCWKYGKILCMPSGRLLFSMCNSHVLPDNHGHARNQFGTRVVPAFNFRNPQSVEMRCKQQPLFGIALFYWCLLEIGCLLVGIVVYGGKNAALDPIASRLVPARSRSSNNGLEEGYVKTPLFAESYPAIHRTYGGGEQCPTARQLGG